MIDIDFTYTNVEPKQEKFIPFIFPCQYTIDCGCGDWVMDCGLEVLMQQILDEGWTIKEDEYGEPTPCCPRCSKL